ncbi:MAG: hypothetical protein ABEI86_06905 [Halobacteriaceae archaeon]
MYGVVTRNEEEVAWEEFDISFYEVKDVTGRHVDPHPNAVNMISCFGDTATAEAKPEFVPEDKEGNKATRDRPYFDWGYICPTINSYQQGLLDIIDTCIEVNSDVRLDDVGFPRDEYCYCDRCEAAYSESEYSNRNEWRADVITDFVYSATEQIPGTTYLTLYPDPYPGHLYERMGLDLDALANAVDEFVVPLYDMAYETTYWIESLAKGFADLVDNPFNIELYAVNIDIDNLLSATEVAAEYAKDVYFGYDASTARAAIRRKNAQSNQSETHQPDS